MFRLFVSLWRVPTAASVWELLPSLVYKRFNKKHVNTMVCASLCSGKKKKSHDSVGKHVEEFATKIIFVLTEYHCEYSCH